MAGEEERVRAETYGLAAWLLKGRRGCGLWAAGSCGGGMVLRPKAAVW